MIDFRYHIVSLTAVFIALAVGLILGAGPLQGKIGETLSGQVDSLRTDRDKLHDQLQETRAHAAQNESVLTALTAPIVRETLAEKRIAVVTLPGTSDDDVVELNNAIASAQGTVTGRVELTDAWTAGANRTYRETLTGQLAGYLPEGATEGKTSAQVQGMALSTMLAGKQEQGGFSTQAQTLAKLFSGGDSPLVKVKKELVAPADAVVVVGPRDQPANPAATTVKENQGQDTPISQSLAAMGALVPEVVLGAAQTGTDLVAEVRSAPAAAGVTSTVDSVGTKSSNITTVLALWEKLAGKNGHYGFSKGAAATTVAK